MKKVDNFIKALDNLKEIFNYDEPYENVVLTGLVSYYSICFEQSWKAMEEILEKYGYDNSATGSPKMILKTAYIAGMIKDEQLWVEALIEKNNVAHSYNEKTALGIIRNTKEKFYDMFVELKKEIEENWK